MTRTTLRAALPLLLVLLAACPSPRMPSGPPPEYEEPPRPSWLDAGAPAPETAATDVAPTPAPHDAGTD